MRRDKLGRFTKSRSFRTVSAMRSDIVNEIKAERLEAEIGSTVARAVVIATIIGTFFMFC